MPYLGYAFVAFLVILALDRDKKTGSQYVPEKDIDRTDRKLSELRNQVNELEFEVKTLKHRTDELTWRL